MRVALHGDGFASWGGGIHFLRIVADALTADPSDRYEVYVLNPELDVRAAAQILNKAAKNLATAPAVVRNDLLARTAASKNVRREFSGLADVSVVACGTGPKKLARLVRKLGAHALLPTLKPLGSGFPAPWIGYLYDFQHKYLPQLFTEEAVRERDRSFSSMLSQARCVIVNAKAVETDARTFFPGSRCEIVSLPFSAAPRPEWFEDQRGVLKSYGLNRPYFLISNQFWLHKDHQTAFEAFRIFSNRNPDCELVCTGATTDPRDPEHFSRLVSKLERDGTRQRTHILGMIPKRHQIEIMKHAVAVIQPTLFEGGPGGGAVFDAVSLGKRSIVSDIPVNLELTEDGVVFFRAGDAKQLCGLMQDALRESGPQASPEELVRRGNERLVRCGRVLKYAIASVKRS